MKVDEFCSKLDSRLAGCTSAEERLEAAVNALCQAFGVTSHEVAIFSFSPVQESLSFLWPAALRSSGAVPISAHKSLVAQTARDRKASFNNTFAATPHASFFERFRQKGADNSHPIQKIMSVPLDKDGVVQWVIQLSRKGEDAAAAGRDFTANELTAMEKIGKVLAQHL
jgi:hypothetical protein